MHLRRDWKAWLACGLAAVGMFVWSLDVHGPGARLLAAVAGALAAAMVVGWMVGGHVSALRWSWGAEGERATATELTKLGDGWHAEHDIEHDYGNWDHVLVGPGGVYLLDSKSLNSPATVSEDALRSGRLVYRGASARGGARRLHELLTERLARAPWVQPVVVVWAEFAHDWHEERGVIYVHGSKLREMLDQRPRVIQPEFATTITETVRALAATLGRQP